MKKKGIGALEIIFGMFVLIIVVLVLIRMFTAIVKPDKINEQLRAFEDAYQITAQKASCNQVCDSYRDGNCNRRDAVDYCLKKVNLDITGDKRPGEKYRGNFVRSLPYCEDALYCFHVTDCSCGNYRLTAENCLRVLCDYYQLDEGLPGDTAIKLITNENTGIYSGSCNKDPKMWADLGYTPPTDLQADWWWQQAGYASASCMNIVTGGSLTLSNCKLDKTTTPWSIDCNTGCNSASGIVVLNGEYTPTVGATPTVSGGKVRSQPSITNTLNQICTKAPDTWTVQLICTGPQGKATAALTVDSC